METIQSKSMLKQSSMDIDGTEGARRATVVPSMSGTSATASPSPPDPEVTEKKPRRKYTAAYKLRILKQYESCTVPGEIGALLRREGLYHSNVNTWIRQRDNGALQGLAPKKRGRKSKTVNPLAREVAKLQRENKKLAEKLHQAESIIEVQKKISEILGISQNNSGETK